MRRGSSPLTRGKPGVDARREHGSGLIPAHAGKTTHSFPGRRNGAAHPRSRGENIVVSAPIIIRQGSSPLTQGKPHGHPVRARRPGLIPAHAGKTGGDLRGELLEGAHPRSRGENEIVIALVRSGTGSSPLTRGKPGPCRARARSCGLIPAHAGKTSIRSLRSTIFRAHPRSRGENRMICRSAAARRGSSPLTRGKLRHEQRLPARDRLIPAHAGKTRSSSSSTSTRRAHPRSRGENRTVTLYARGDLGSSPRRRGKHGERRLADAGTRLIPA